jgi:CRP-like cAMP-binding protein
MLSLLESVPIFAGLEPATLDLLRREGDDYAFADGDILFREGEPDDALYVITNGKIRIWSKFGERDQEELALLHKTELLGETCLLETLPHTATAQTVGPTSVLSISGRTFHELYSKMPKQYGILMLNIARDLSRRLRLLDNHYKRHALEAPLSN